MKKASASASKSALAFGFASVLLATLSTTSFVDAADKAPVSSLPILPKQTLLPETKAGVAGLTSKEKGASPGPKYIEITADTKAGYCIVGREYGLRLTATSSYNSLAEDEVWHFQEDKEKKTATLERMGYDLPMGEKALHTKTTKSVIKLARVAESPRVTVWGFRESNGDIVILAKNATVGRETGTRKSEDFDTTLQTTSSDCTFGAVRLLSNQLPKGGVAQLRGHLPPIGEGKSKVIPHFTIDVSAAKLSHDPEPLLSIRIRESEI